MSTTEMDRGIRIGTPVMVEHLVKNFALSYPLLKLAKSRKDLMVVTYARINEDIKAIREQSKEEIYA